MIAFGAFASGLVLGGLAVGFLLWSGFHAQLVAQREAHDTDVARREWLHNLQHLSARQGVFGPELPEMPAVERTVKPLTLPTRGLPFDESRVVRKVALQR